jgi:uncharacterized protein DUF4350
MPNPLDRGDRKLLIGAGVLLVLLIIASTAVSRSQADASISFYTSSYSASWDGAKATYLLLQELGYQAVRWDESPTKLEENRAGVLILAQPMQAPTEDEKLAIHQFLQDGGRVVATGATAAMFLPEAGEFSPGFPLQEQTNFRPLLPSPLIRNAPEISMIAPEHWQPKSPVQLVVYGNDDTAAVISYSVGKGQVIWWGASTPLTNAGIRESGNLALFLNSVGPPNSARVLWDEYFHGAHGSIWTYLARTPWLWGIAQIGIVFLAILATHSRRQGPISAPRAVSRLSPLEFVETLGDLYFSAHAGSAAVRIAYQRLRFQLTRRLGLAASVSDAELAEAASLALSWNEREFSDTLSRSERAMKADKIDDADTLNLVREIFDYSSRLEPAHSRTGARSQIAAQSRTEETQPA